jgi:hypothetical protein
MSASASGLHSLNTETHRLRAMFYNICPRCHLFAINYCQKTFFLKADLEALTASHFFSGQFIKSI